MLGVGTCPTPNTLGDKMLTEYSKMLDICIEKKSKLSKKERKFIDSITYSAFITETQINDLTLIWEKATENK